MRTARIFIPTLCFFGCTGANESAPVPSGTRPVAAESCEPRGAECLPPASAQERARRAERGPLNVTGAPLQTCSVDPMTGFFRNGRCETGPTDRGVHVVCAEVDAEFLSYTKRRGNDLSTPRGSFAGLVPGDRWCLCAARWEEARRAGFAPRVVIEATDEAALRLLERDTLEAHALSSANDVRVGR